MLHSLTCRGGMVSAPHHLAAQAGANVLRDGGNAVEAMVAAAAAIAVVYPHRRSTWRRLGLGLCQHGLGFFWRLGFTNHLPI